ncbi:MAG TPA: hypothetical protein VF984_06820, partial [Actinomycetota bacterium]
LIEQLASMQDRLLGVARELEAAIDRDEAHTVVIDDAAPSEREAGEEPVPARARSAGAGQAGSEDERQPPAEGVTGEFEELWTGTEADADLAIPDIPPLDLGWEDDDQDA